MNEEQIFEAATETAIEAVGLVLDMGADRDQAVEIGRQAFRERALELAGPSESRGDSTREYRNDLQSREV